MTNKSVTSNTENVYAIENLICDLRLAIDMMTVRKKAQELVVVSEGHLDKRINDIVENAKKERNHFMEQAFTRGLEGFKFALQQHEDELKNHLDATLAKVRNEFAEVRNEFAEVRNEVREVKKDLGELQVKVETMSKYNVWSFIALLVGLIGFFATLIGIAMKVIKFIP